MKFKQTDGLVSTARTWGYDIVWIFSAVIWPLIVSTARPRGQLQEDNSKRPERQIFLLYLY